MGDVYASAVGTTVLQLKEIPLRPQIFDGALCLFDLKPGVDEAAVRLALSRFGEIKSVNLAVSPPVVRFTTHAAALHVTAFTFSELCGGVDMQYNGRSYDGRGWCGPQSRTPPLHLLLPPPVARTRHGRATAHWNRAQVLLRGRCER